MYDKGTWHMHRYYTERRTAHRSHDKWHIDTENAPSFTSSVGLAQACPSDISYYCSYTPTSSPHTMNTCNGQQ